MKRTFLLCLLLMSFMGLFAQWVDDPMNNTFIANCNKAAGEIYVATDQLSGDTYVQWDYQGDNGWSPWVQRLNSEGEPQWPADGIHITTPDFATWSPGYAMTTVEGSVVSTFRTLGPHHWAVKINADGTFPWGEHGIMLFNGEGGGRSEILAGDDGGVWALGTDMDISYLQYVNADGTLRQMATIADFTKKCTNGILVPAENGVFVVYAKQTIQGYSNYVKEIYVAKYNKDGELIIPETLLLGQQTVGMAYVHYAISDGMGGGYVYQWHNGIGGVYNTYVTHFDATGTPTISETNGITVHSYDPSHFYTNADVTIDPLNHDLIIAYRQTDSDAQVQDMVMMNRITALGEKPWNDGLNVTDNIADYSDISVDSFEYGEGFAVIYSAGSTVLAKGYDMEGNSLWNTTMSSSSYEKSISENSTGFYLGQNIVAWVNSNTGNVYGQNIGWDGTMGMVTPPTPPAPCDAPENFDGSYFYDDESGNYGVILSWDAPTVLPMHYKLESTPLPYGCSDITEIDSEITEFPFVTTVIGPMIFRLSAVYDNCQSSYALTPDGEDYLIIEILDPTSVSEVEFEDFVDIMAIYTIQGQLINAKDIHELKPGMYIVKGTTASGKTAIVKTIKN